MMAKFKKIFRSWRKLLFSLNVAAVHPHIFQFRIDLSSTIFRKCSSGVSFWAQSSSSPTFLLAQYARNPLMFDPQLQTPEQSE
jgi:hypothetical protein